MVRCLQTTFVFLLCCLSISSFAQIIAPDTVCLGTPINFTTPKPAVTYAWDFDSMNVVQTVTPLSTLYTGSPLNVCGTGSMAKDGSNIYFFVPNYVTQDIIRFNFGNSIHNTPVVTNMGAFGLTSGSLPALDIVKDSATNQWYGIAANYGQLLILSFGTSLSNTPTSIVRTMAAVQWGHEIKLMRYGGNWIAFLGNRNSNMVRFDFGSSPTNVPAVTNIPNVGGLSTPCSFSLYQQGGNWYMLIPSLISGNLTRYEFGPNLLNNTPTGVSLGNPGGFFRIPRPINLFNDCQNNLIAYVGNENGDLIKLNFGGSITSVPVPTFLGPTGIRHFGGTSPLNYNDSFALICPDATLNKIWFYNPLHFTPPTFINYYNPNQSYTYTTPGLHHVSLFCDMAYCTGPSVYCKDVFVTTGYGVYSRRDTVICTGSPFTLRSDTVGTYVWSTGATTSSISVSSGGTYWVKTVTSSCTFQVDTIVVSSTLRVSLGNDTSVCTGNTITLNPSVPSGAVLTWSTGATGPTINVSSTGTYWVRATAGACSVTDTIHVLVSPKPPVHLGPDLDECAGIPIILRSSDTYVSPVYQWNTGSSSATVTPVFSGTYWLRVTVAGCSGTDTVNVNFKPQPHVSLGSDVSFCVGDSVILIPTGSSISRLLWSTGATSSTIKVTSTGSYWVKVDSAGCYGSDTVNALVNPIPVVDLGPDQSVCSGTPVTLKSLNTYSSPTYLWSTANTSPEINVSTSGNYELTVTENGCTGKDNANVIIRPTPVVSLGNDTVVCPGTILTLIGNVPVGAQYLWSTGSTAPEIQVSTSGIYTLTVTIEGCSSSDVITVTVENSSYKPVYLGPDTSLCLGEYVMLSVFDNNALWSNNTTGNNLKVEYPGTYWVKVQEGCGVVSDTIKIDYHICDIAFPSAFTPNGDGVNDLIGVVGTLKYYKDFSLSIFNRWGDRVFFTEDIYAGWDGVFNGQKQDIGTYFYMVFYSFEGKKHMLKGDFELIR